MFIVQDKPKSISAESYRTLRTNIQYSSFDKEIKTILVTSATPAEGKSTTAGNLALSIAQGEKKVILIDCDLRKPSLHKKFRISNMMGLSDVMLGEVKLIDGLYKYNDYMHILTSGKLPPNPSEMLASNAMSNLIEDLKKVYDYIVLDTAPVIAVTDAQVLATKVDGVILVVKAQDTKKEIVREAKALLNKVNANILGTVLNGVQISKDKYHYYYGEGEGARVKK